MQDNPFRKKSVLDFELPDFGQIQDDQFQAAFEEAIEWHAAEIEAILSSETITFENTIEALERAGQYLSRVLAVFYNKSSSDTNETIDELEQIIAPKLTKHQDSIRLNPYLFERIDNLVQRLDALHLDQESRYLVERYHREFQLSGAGLSSDKRNQLKTINEEISVLEAKFSKALLGDTNDLAIEISDVSQLDGLSEDEIAAAKQAATDRGISDKWLITMVNYTGHYWLANLKNRALRERIMLNSLSKGSRDNVNDTQKIVIEIASLRARRAQLLGFRNHAEAVTADETAKSPENVHKMLRLITPAAIANAQSEAEELLSVAKTELGASEFACWDWDFYSNQIRQAVHKIDTSKMKPYFELESVLKNGVFFAAERLFGIEFLERSDLTSYHPEARIWQVNEVGGSALGLYIGDFYARDSKRGGAWMNELVAQNRLLNQKAVVVNNLNIPKPPRGSATLLTFDEVETLFHEFGHAIHGILSQVRYPHFSGTNVHRDFVEFPSQVFEMWMLWPEVLQNYAKHFETGEPLPRDWIESLKAAEKFNQGFETTSYLQATVIDLAWHELEPTQVITDVSEFETNALENYGLNFDLIPPRYRSSYFSHIFSGGYSAGYYGYIWSEILDADTVEWFRTNGGLTRENGQRFRQLLLARGGSKDAMEIYREFRGKDATIEPLLARRGLKI